MKKEKKYISVDIEASGRTPGKYSMLSLGACVVGDTDQQFYREIKPISDNYIESAMKIACLGLNCLKELKSVYVYDPTSMFFSGELVLEKLTAEGEEPEIVMSDFHDWIVRVTQGFWPVLAATPIVFDGMFVAWYFDNFYEGENPFGHSGEDINSMYRGAKSKLNANIKDLGLRKKRKLTHNALEDAIQQAKEMEKVLRMIRGNRRKR